MNKGILLLACSLGVVAAVLLVGNGADPAAREIEPVIHLSQGSVSQAFSPDTQVSAPVGQLSITQANVKPFVVPEAPDVAWKNNDEENSVSESPAPGLTEATVVESPPLNPMDRFNRETVDFYRAGDLEHGYIDLFSTHPLLADYALADARCKSEYCRISVAVMDRDQTVRLVTALSTSLLEKYGQVNLQIGSYDDNGFAEFYIRSVAADASNEVQKDL